MVLESSQRDRGHPRSSMVMSHSASRRLHPELGRSIRHGNRRSRPMRQEPVEDQQGQGESGHRAHKCSS